MSSLLDLGPELLQDIASYLELCDAQSLARTCSALQDAGESQIWFKLDLHFDGNSIGNFNLWRKANSHVVKEDFLRSVEQGDDELQGALTYLAPLLNSRPQRCGFVREVSVNCQRITPFTDDRFHPWRAKLLAILESPDEQSRVLNDAGFQETGADEVDDPTFDLVAYDAGQRQGEDDDRQHLRRNFASEDVPILQPALAEALSQFPVLPGVKDLSIQLGETTWREYTSAWSRILPHVTSLTVDWHYREQYPSIQRQAEAERCPWVPWTSVLAFHFHFLPEPLTDFVVTHLLTCRSLRSFSFSRHPSIPISPHESPTRRTVAVALAAASGLTYINVPEPFRAIILEAWRAEGEGGESKADEAVEEWKELDEFFALAWGKFGSFNEMARLMEEQAEAPRLDPRIPRLAMTRIDYTGRYESGVRAKHNKAQVSSWPAGGEGGSLGITPCS